MRKNREKWYCEQGVKCLDYLFGHFTAASKVTLIGSSLCSDWFPFSIKARQPTKRNSNPVDFSGNKDYVSTAYGTTQYISIDVGGDLRCGSACHHLWRRSANREQVIASLGIT